jgi:excisionase family DNA binding protein
VVSAPVVWESVFLREHGEMDASDPARDDAFQRIVAETAAREAQHYLTTRQMAERLGIEVSDVREWSNANRLTAQRLGPKLTFPAWQLCDDTDGGVIPLPHLTDVVWAIPGDMRNATWIMTTAQPELAIDDVRLSPAIWLARGGDVEPVLRILGESIHW